MKIDIFWNKPLITFQLLDKSDKLLDCDFLIDTWLTESIVFVINKNNSSLLKIINTYWLKELKEDKWIELWDWKKVKTYTWNIVSNFFWKNEEIKVLFIEWEKDDMPVLWIEFLKQNEKSLILNFKENNFELN